jgi:4-amino-4-deoxy-L-arabinose transferase-like glycosyltransferase
LPTSPTLSTHHSAALLAALIAVSGLTRLTLSGLDVINVDEASYMVGASELLRGHLPYSTFGDNKPPLIYVYYAVSQLIFGHGIGAVRVFTALVTMPFTALAVSAFYRHDRRGIVGAALFLLYSASYTASDMLAVNCEPVMMLPLAWALVALRDSDRAVRPEQTFLAGLLIGVGALVKYQAALWVPAVACAVGFAAWERGVSMRRPLVALALGVGLPVTATVMFFGVTGGLGGFVYWNVVHNIEYLQNPTSTSEALGRGLGRVLPFLAVTAPLWYGWFRSSAQAPSRYWDVFVAGLIGASAAAACLGLRFFPHYFVQLYVPLALAAAPWAAAALASPMQLPGLAVAAIAVLTCGGWTTANALTVVTRTAPALNRTAAAVAARVKADPCYGASSLFVWGSAPEFYYHARLRPASQFFFPEYPLVRYYAGNPAATALGARPRRRSPRMRHWIRLMTELATSRPTYILDTAPAGIARWQYFPVRDYPMLHRLLQRQYTTIDTVEGVDIYRRNDCRPATVVDGR